MQPYGFHAEGYEMEAVAIFLLFMRSNGARASSTGPSYENPDELTGTFS